MKNAGQYAIVVLILFIPVHCKEDPVNTLLKLLDRMDNKPMVEHIHSHATDPVMNLFQLFDRTNQKPMVVVMEKGEEPRTLDFVVDDGTGSDHSIRDMFGLASATDYKSEDESLEEEDEKSLEALAQYLLSESNVGQVQQQISILRQDLISRCGQKTQCGNKKNQCDTKTANCKKIDTCSEEETVDECETTTTKCPKKWFSTGRPSW